MPNWDQAAWERGKDGPVTHTLKTLPEFYDAVERGEKNFEVRKNDRGFAVNDELLLLRYDWGEWDAPPVIRTTRRRVAYMLKGGWFGIEPGYCVMGLEKI